MIARFWDFRDFSNLSGFVTFNFIVILVVLCDFLLLFFDRYLYFFSFSS